MYVSSLGGSHLMQILFYFSDDGTGPDKMAHISGPPDRCEHAAQIINDLLQSIRVREEGQGVLVTHTFQLTLKHSLSHLNDCRP